MIQYIYDFINYVKVNYLYYCKNCKNQKVDKVFGICIFCEIENYPDFYSDIF